jgi:hypothetical protein
MKRVLINHLSIDTNMRFNCMQLRYAKSLLASVRNVPEIESSKPKVPVEDRNHPYFLTRSSSTIPVHSSSVGGCVSVLSMPRT